VTPAWQSSGREANHDPLLTAFLADFSPESLPRRHIFGRRGKDLRREGRLESEQQAGSRLADGRPGAEFAEALKLAAHADRLGHGQLEPGAEGIDGAAIREAGAERTIDQRIVGEEAADAAEGQRVIGREGAVPIGRALEFDAGDDAVGDGEIGADDDAERAVEAAAGEGTAAA